MILDVPTGLLVTAIGGFASAIGSNLVLFFRHATYVTTRLEIHDLSIAEMKQDVERVRVRSEALESKLFVELADLKDRISTGQAHTGERLAAIEAVLKQVRCSS